MTRFVTTDDCPDRLTGRVAELSATRNLDDEAANAVGETIGTRTVMEYLLSPVSKTLHEAGRELRAPKNHVCLGARNADSSEAL